ncbi:ECU11_1755 [Encephalitozoon cuniculi GB-M1]|uniref:ECU11_1755 protein n=1 Tax=Encephalitozoon cuniculi (strain GB-M1) TaxID=284813 RepID=I7L4K5_ENCCU|nr:uncharacterized protein ECU11_1755 [Encephalitozoon cuniculi GB-M1]CCI74000.1 ECU11_1755 [Encephalitozoon cuniculi GB-M1]
MAKKMDNEKNQSEEKNKKKAPFRIIISKSSKKKSPEADVSTADIAIFLIFLVFFILMVGIMVFLYVSGSTRSSHFHSPPQSTSPHAAQTSPQAYPQAHPFKPSPSAPPLSSFEPAPSAPPLSSFNEPPPSYESVITGEEGRYNHNRLRFYHQ